MYRKSLALLATGLILFAALLVQMSIAQAAAPSQAAPDAEEPQPLPQPLRIRINQAIPLTISVPASLLAGGAPVTTAVTTTGAITGSAGAVSESRPNTPTVSASRAVTGTAATTATEELTATGALTEAAELTATATTTEAVEGAAANAEEPLTDTAVVTESDILTTVMPMASMPVTLELSLDLVVSETLTSTVPASVTLQLADLTTRTLPVSVTVAPLPDGQVVLELLPAPEVATPEVTPEVTPTEEITATPTTEATPAVTATAEATPTTEVTATVQAPSGLPVVETTATTTANLRAGPATTFDLVGQVGPGATIAVVGISEDGQWYLLDGGTWIATFLAADTQIPNLPIATQELVDQASGTTPVVAATPAVTATTVVTSAVTPAATPAATATPVPAASTAVTPTTTTDANLRAGPGTEFPIIGGTINGQAINIVGRNADGTWFRLDNTGWIFGELVANPPALDTVPVVNADGTPVEVPAATPVPATGGGLPLPTATPAGAATGSTTAEAVAAASTETSAATGPNAAYIGEVQALIARYDGIAQTMDALIAEATTNGAALTTPAWADRVNAAVGLLRTTGASVAELQAPAALAGAQQDLVTAAQQYTAAGAALAQAVATGAADQLNVANSSIELANTSLTAVERALAAAQ